MKFRNKDSSGNPFFFCRNAPSGAFGICDGKRKKIATDSLVLQIFEMDFALGNLQKLPKKRKRK